MPYYDLGVKSQLNDRWFHTMAIEFGYIIAYSDQIDIDDILGIQINGFFAFGYQL